MQNSYNRAMRKPFEMLKEEYIGNETERENILTIYFKNEKREKNW